ncbi:MAG: hypothetical protein KGZ74_12680 [Chitinophagaceae bacterium]|nr:hypothetical protein [Chitinophagaceae bacterium]
MNKKNDEFYIGWMQAAPESFAKHAKKILLVAGLLVVVLAITLSLQQRKFSTAIFEYGMLTEVTGIYQSYPVPSLKVFSKTDANGKQELITMPLVGYGKFGAAGIIAKLEQQKGFSFHQHQVTLKGTLIYSDGKSLLQIDEHDQPLVAVQTHISTVRPLIKELGSTDLIGEILDPKCYFGVMKPGRGKPHKDCAIRCIAGGISPVFYVRRRDAGPFYYLLLNEKGKPLNEFVQDYVADPVKLHARAVQYDDWIVLYVDTKAKLQRTGGLSWFKENEELIFCNPQ